ncbi:MAG: protein translocase subunit SecF [Vulcanibacillus sp.]
MNFNFDFTKKNKIYFSISGAIILIGIISLFVFGLNLGIDFISGSRIEISIEKTFNENDVTDLLGEVEVKAKEEGIENINLTPSSITTAGDKNDIAVVRFDTTLDSGVLPIIKEVFRTEYGDQVELNESKVNPTIGRETAKNALYAVLVASIGIIIYVTVRFEYRFAIAAVIALLHDAFFVITIFSILNIEVDMTFIAAILTIVGYSINDTIVIFDRIRENLKTAKLKRKEDLEEVVNRSLNQTLVRSINTTLTVLIAALALYILGGEGIKNFSFALLLGLFIGAYSSIFIASQIWLVWKIRGFKKNELKLKSE